MNHHFKDEEIGKVREIKEADILFFFFFFHFCLFVVVLAQTTEFYVLTVLEAGSPKQSRKKGWFLVSVETFLPGL